MVLFAISVFIVGLIVLIKSADVLVDAAAKIARTFKVSHFLIGVTIVAIGTSLPELAAGVTASILGSPGLTFGNIIGSSIANIALILGISAIVVPLTIKKKVFETDLQILLAVTVIFYLFALDNVISLIEGIILIIGFLYYLAFLLKFKPKIKHFVKYKKYLKAFHGVPIHLVDHKLKKRMKKQVILLIAGLIGIILGAEVLIFGAKEIALFFSVPETIIGLTLMSIGTTAPELSVSLAAVRKKFYGMVIGNIIGSNIFNLLLIGGISSMIIALPIDAFSIMYIMPFALILTVLLMIFAWSNWKLSRKEGITLLILYLLFLAFIGLHLIGLF